MNRLVRQLISPFLTEQVKAKRVIAIYPGRFQPFGPHHRKVFQNLQSKFGDVYITTSGIKQPPRHPMNFSEKVRHMVKMGIPKNRIVKERVPYVANNLLKKFKDDTAVVYVFGAKDAGRLKGGKKKSGGLTYYQDYNKNKGNLLGYKEHGYIYTAPTVKVSGITSGTEIRNLIGSSKMERSKREKIFKQTFGYFDKGIFNMLTNKFRKLTEEKEFKAKSKESGRVVVYKSKENMDNAIKTGRAEPLDKKTSDKPEKTKGQDLFKKEQDNWERIDNKSNRVKSKDYTDEQYEEETGEYFDNKKTMGVVPNAFKDKNDMIKKMKSARSVYLSSNKMEFMDNTDVGDILKSDNSLELGKQRAKEYGKDWNRLEKAINSGNPVPPPIAMKDKNGDYYLLAGNTRLMSYTASGKKLPIKVIDYDGEFEYPQNETTIKEKIDLSEEVQLLIEGGAYGHMSHPFDDNNLTFGDMKKIIKLGLSGQLNREEDVTEKTDGQNLMITYRDGKVVAARNKGQIKNRGKNALDVNSVAKKFSGRGDIRDAFVFAMKDLSRAIKSLSDKQKDKVFKNGEIFMNLEIIYPASSNVIDYDKAVLQFHNSLQYNKDGNAVGEVKGSGRMLQGMIKQVNQDIQKHFKIIKPKVLTLPKKIDFGKKVDIYYKRVNKLQSQFGLKDTDTLGLYHQSYWEDYIYNAGKQFGYTIPKTILKKLTKRWAFFDKSYKIPDIKKDLKKQPKFLEWVLTTDKVDHKNMVKKNMLPFEKIFFSVGADILQNLSNFIAANPTKAVEKIRKDILKASNKVRAGGDIKKMKTLKQQLEKLNSIGGLKKIVPVEGVVFKYKGKTYKFTGAFAPVNQILGLVSF